MKASGLLTKIYRINSAYDNLISFDHILKGNMSITL